MSFAAEAPAPVQPAAATPAGNETAADAGGVGAQKVLAIVAGGIGVVGAGLGTAFGLMALSAKNDAQNACPAQCATHDGVDKWSDAGSKGNVATAAFIVGGVGLATGAVLWLTAGGSGERPAAQVGLGPGLLQVRGTWQ